MNLQKAGIFVGLKILEVIGLIIVLSIIFKIFGLIFGTIHISGATIAALIAFGFVHTFFAAISYGIIDDSNGFLDDWYNGSKFMKTVGVITLSFCWYYFLTALFVVAFFFGKFVNWISISVGIGNLAKDASSYIPIGFITLIGGALLTLLITIWFHYNSIWSEKLLDKFKKSN